MATFFHPGPSMISTIQVSSVFCEHEKWTEAVKCISLFYFGSYPTPHPRCTHTTTPLSPLPREAPPDPHTLTHQLPLPTGSPAQTDGCPTAMESSSKNIPPILPHTVLPSSLVLLTLSPLSMRSVELRKKGQPPTLT